LANQSQILNLWMLLEILFDLHVVTTFQTTWMFSNDRDEFEFVCRDIPLLGPWDSSSRESCMAILIINIIIVFFLYLERESLCIVLYSFSPCWPKVFSVVSAKTPLPYLLVTVYSTISPARTIVRNLSCTKPRDKHD